MIFEIGKKSNNLETKVLYLDNWRASGNGFFLPRQTQLRRSELSFVCINKCAEIEGIIRKASTSTLSIFVNPIRD